MLDPSELPTAARIFVAAAFDVLSQDRIIPTSAYHPYIKVGRDYYGMQIHGLPQYNLLEQQLNECYPNRFAEPLKRRGPEFASTYMFSLLEAAVARCGRSGDFRPDSPSVEESISEMLSVLDASQYEVVCCRVVSHLTTKSGTAQVGSVTVVPADDGRSAVQAICTEIPGAYSAAVTHPSCTTHRFRCSLSRR